MVTLRGACKRRFEPNSFLAWRVRSGHAPMRARAHVSFPPIYYSHGDRGFRTMTRSPIAMGSPRGWSVCKLGPFAHSDNLTFSMYKYGELSLLGRAEIAWRKRDVNHYVCSWHHQRCGRIFEEVTLYICVVVSGGYFFLDEMVMPFGTEGQNLWTILSSLKSDQEFQFSKKLGPRIGILVDACRFAGFAVLTARPFVTTCAIRGQFVVLPRLPFSSKGIALSNIIKTCYKRRAIQQTEKYTTSFEVSNSPSFVVKKQTNGDLLYLKRLRNILPIKRVIIPLNARSCSEASEEAVLSEQ